MGDKHTISDLYQMQSLPLEAKIRMTMARIEGWIDEYGTEGVYISFSGGKDSTVLLDIVRNKLGYDEIPAVFVDVPTQYPELKQFAQTWDNVEIIKPKIGFAQVCEKYGFPLISKEVSNNVSEVRTQIKKGKDVPSYRMDKLNGTAIDKKTGELSAFNMPQWKFLLEADFDVSDKCCNVMKKKPAHDYTKRTGRKPITAQMADESRLRKEQWLKNGCNGFKMKNPISNPMSFWTEQDILQYIVKYNLPICSVYGDVIEDYRDQLEGQMHIADYGLAEKETYYKTTGCKRTGCMLCGFGCHLEKSPNRFELLKESHPKMYALLDVIKNNGISMREAIEWTNEHGNINIKL